MNNIYRYFLVKDMLINYTYCLRYIYIYIVLEQLFKGDFSCYLILSSNKKLLYFKLVVKNLKKLKKYFLIFIILKFNLN